MIERINVSSDCSTKSHVLLAREGESLASELLGRHAPKGCEVIGVSTLRVPAVGSHVVVRGYEHVRQLLWAMLPGLRCSEEPPHDNVAGVLRKDAV
jgi:hypothetical protein